MVIVQISHFLPKKLNRFYFFHLPWFSITYFAFPILEGRAKVPSWDPPQVFIIYSCKKEKCVINRTYAFKYKYKKRLACNLFPFSYSFYRCQTQETREECHHAKKLNASLQWFDLHVPLTVPSNFQAGELAHNLWHGKWWWSQLSPQHCSSFHHLHKGK